MKLRSNIFLKRVQASAAFELMAVVSISGLVSTSLIPLLGSSAEVDRLQRTMLRSKLDAYLFDMEAANLGVNVDQFPTELSVATEESG